MKNSEVAKVFQDIADLLELKGENVFKIRAYQKAARAIEHYPRELKAMIDEGEELQSIPGVGEAIAKKATELITTSKLGYYENLKAEFPQGITNLLAIPGIGPKTANKLSSELGFDSACTDAERFADSMQIPDAAGGNGLRVGVEIKDLDRDISLIICFVKNFNQGGELQIPESGSATVGIIDVHVLELARFKRGLEYAGQFGSGRWSPHVTLARRVATDQLGSAVGALARTADRTVRARVTRCRRWDGTRKTAWWL